MTAAAGYSGTPLPRKLGVKAGSRLLVVDAPDGFELDPLPPEVVLHRRPGRTPYDVVLAFCPDLATVGRRFGSLVDRLDTAGALWICWPKKSGGVPTDVSENLVRDVGLAAGLVDVKVAAVDEIWSGLKFVRRLRDR